MTINTDKLPYASFRMSTRFRSWLPELSHNWATYATNRRVLSIIPVGAKLDRASTRFRWGFCDLMVVWP